MQVGAHSSHMTFPIIRMSPSVVIGLIFVGMPIGWPTKSLANKDAQTSITLNEIIEGLRANEAKTSLVVIEGSYALARTDASGRPVFGRTDRFFRFSRSNEVIKVERRGEYSADGVVRAEFDEVIFHSPDSTINIFLPGATKAEKWSPETPSPYERPSPFPLLFGFGLDYASRSIPQLSSGLERAQRKGVLIARTDPQTPKLILLESTNSTGVIRYWIDPQSGYLVVRRQIELIVRKQGAERILFEKMEAVPKQFDGHWFVASGYCERRIMSTLDPAEEGFLMGTEREEINVRTFKPRVWFKAGELEFSISNFPNLTDIFDHTRNERLNVRTGERTPWGK